MAQRGVAGTAPLVPLLLITALGLCRGQQSTVAEEREGTCDLLTGANCKNEVHNPLELFAVQNLVVAGETPLEGSSRPAGPKLWTNITHYSKSGTWVEVWWSNVVNPRLDDLVALYVPADADPRKTAPVKFQYAFRSPTHRTLGAGHLRFKLLNLRQDVAFMFIRGGLQFPVVTAKSNTVRNTNPNEPLQGHLSLTGKAGQVLVQWATRDTGNPVARWGTKPGHYTHAAPATSVTYTSKELCGPPATGAGWAEPGMLHAAVVSGLEPRQKYYYVFGDEEFGWSEEGSFYGPVPADHRATVRLLAVADMGQAEEDGSNEVSAMLASRNTTGRLAQEVAQGGYDLLMHNGDISYARGYATQWDTFFDQLGPVVRSLPYMTTIGNHERDWPETGDRFPTQYDSGGECGIPYYRHTRMPTRSEDEHWYSFDMGPVHFLQYSTEHEFEPGSAQYKFMEEDLRGVDRSRTPWVVVGGHRPMYVDSTFGWPPDGDQYVATQLRDSLEPLLRKYAVDVTWHGHHHSYQRTCPVLAGQCVGQNADGSAAAPVHLIIGNAGFALSPNTWPQLPEIFEVVKLEYGYLRVTANATHMQHQMVSSSTGELIDEFTLTKPAGWLLSSAAASTVPLLESQGATQGVAVRA